MKKISIAVLALLFLIIIVFIAFRYQKFSALNKELHSKMLIGLSDFEKRYSLMEYRPRTSDDIDNYSKELGWKGGYHALYQKTGYIFLIQENVYLVQDNSIYPMENISKVMDYFRKHSNDIGIGISDEMWNLSTIKTPEEIKNVGDDIVVYEGSSFSNGVSLYAFSAYFIKNNVFQAITLSGDEKKISIDELIYYVKIVDNLTLQSQ